MSYIVDLQMLGFFMLLMVLVQYRDPTRFPVPRSGIKMRAQIGLALAACGLLAVAGYLSWRFDELSPLTRIFLPIFIFDAALSDAMRRKARAEKATQAAA